MANPMGPVSGPDTHTPATGGAGPAGIGLAPLPLALVLHTLSLCRQETAPRYPASDVG